MNVQMLRLFTRYFNIVLFNDVIKASLFATNIVQLLFSFFSVEIFVDDLEDEGSEPFIDDNHDDDDGDDYRKLKTTPYTLQCSICRFIEQLPGCIYIS